MSGGDDDLAVDDFAVLVHRSNREVEISVGKNRGEANLSILGYQHSIVVNVERRTGSPSLSSSNRHVRPSFKTTTAERDCPSGLTAHTSPTWLDRHSVAALLPHPETANTAVTAPHRTDDVISHWVSTPRTCSARQHSRAQREN
jgi:hypothetical protein